MSSPARAYRWFPPSLLFSVLLGVVFAIWGLFWTDLLAAITFFVLSTAAGFVVHHWGHLPVVSTGADFDHAVDDSAKSTRGAVSKWFDRNADVVRLVGFIVIGLIGIACVSAWDSSGSGFFYDIGTWGGHAGIVIAAISAGMLAAVVGICEFKTSHRVDGWGAQTTTVGTWVIVAASAVPILLVVAVVALMIFFLWVLASALLSS